VSDREKSAPAPRRIALDRPPPPHDPTERVLLGHIDDWEVRDFAVDDPRHRYLLPRGFGHLQLWHPSAHLSILTPSRLTLDRYEAFPVAGWKRRAHDWAALAALLRAETDVQPPSPLSLRALARWFERRSAIDAAVQQRMR
jgi:hypothetical protein